MSWLPSCRREAQPALVVVQRHAEIGRALPDAAVAGRILAAGDCHVAALGALLQDDVDHAGDGIGAVLGRRAVTQHLDMVDRRHRDGIEIHRLRAATEHAVGQR